MFIVAYAFDGLLVLALLFFLFLPITDRRTSWMKLGVMCLIAATLALSVTTSHTPPDTQLASVAHDH